jgi:hypothetical protein
LLRPVLIHGNEPVAGRSIGFEPARVKRGV